MTRHETVDNNGQNVADAAIGYLGAPFRKLAGDQGSLKDGLSHESGFNCSGLVIRAVADGYGKKVDGWDPSMRSVEGMFHRCWGDDRKRVPVADNRKIKPGDIIVWAYCGDVCHCAIAVGSADPADGSVPYIHATAGPDGYGGEVEKGVLKEDTYFDAYRIPLGQLAEAAFGAGLNMKP